MFWLLNLILLGIVYGQTTDPTDATEPTTIAKPTTLPPTSATEATTSATVATTSATVATTFATKATTTKTFGIDQILMDILSKYEADCQGNEELTLLMDDIRFALKLGEEFTDMKAKALANFYAYNKIRILLDEKINQRIDTLNDLLPTLTPKSKCSEFYLKQRRILKEIGKLSNADKQARLTENSVNCQTDEDDDGEYYYVEFED